MADPNKLSVVDTGKPDAVVAKELRDRATPLLEQVCELMNDARRQGLTLNFQLGTDGFGRSRVASLDIVKPL